MRLPLAPPMTEADGAAIDIEDVHRDRAERLVEPENVAAELPIIERPLAGQHLGGERLILGKRRYRRG